MQIGQLAQSITNDVTTGGNYDVLLLPPRMLGDLVADDRLVNLDDYAKKWDPQLDDVFPAYRELYNYLNGSLYTLTMDGDRLELYYRSDLFEAETIERLARHYERLLASAAADSRQRISTLAILDEAEERRIMAWSTPAAADSVIEWESYHHDNRNTGNYDVKLDQGGPSIAKTPLVAAMCEAPTQPEPNDYVVSGGCDCSTAGADTSDTETSALALGVFGLGLGLVARRRRSHVQRKAGKSC